MGSASSKKQHDHTHHELFEEFVENYCEIDASHEDWMLPITTLSALYHTYITKVKNIHPVSGNPSKIVVDILKKSYPDVYLCGFLPHYNNDVYCSVIAVGVRVKKVPRV